MKRFIRFVFRFAMLPFRLLFRVLNPFWWFRLFREMGRRAKPHLIQLARRLRRKDNVMAKRPRKPKPSYEVRVTCPKCGDTKMVGPRDMFWLMYASHSEFRLECCDLTLKKAEFRPCFEEVEVAASPKPVPA